MFFSTILLGLGAITTLGVSPVAALPRKRSTSVVSAAEFESFTPFAFFAAAAYCAPEKTLTWKCGPFCDAHPEFQPTISGGDGNDIQFFFVGYNPPDNSVVVGHQGTDSFKVLSVLTDLNFLPTGLDKEHFPGAPAVTVHQGFLEAHDDTASQVLAETKRLIETKGANNVVVVGHSLGGAKAELDALMFRMVLPKEIKVRGVTFGTPRVGTPEFAAFFDSMVPDFQRINNDRDPVPTVPGRFLGFSQVGIETHIVEDGPILRCAGRDNADDKDCSVLAVGKIALLGNPLDHLGPYGKEKIMMGSIFC